MSVRLISGDFGGRVIETPSGSITHPMSERVRGALFNMIKDETADAVVLDAFAGSGALGYESLSREAKSVTFVDNNQQAQKVLRSNARLLGVDSRVSVINKDVKKFIETNTETQFDLIFCDPPYNKMQLSTVFLLGRLLKSNGLMVLSYIGRGEIPQVDKVVVVDNRSYGKANLAFYRHK